MVTLEPQWGVAPFDRALPDVKVPNHVRYTDEPIPRLWLVFFSDGHSPAWWTWAFRPGFRHISAASFYAAENRWVLFDPGWRGTRIELYTPEEFGPLLGQMLNREGAVLRVRSRYARGGTPAGWHCVGAIKGLLGIRSCALAPATLWRHLVRDGAEIVEVPGVEPVWRTKAAC